MPYSDNASRRTLPLGIGLGGTKIEIIALDKALAQVLSILDPDVIVLGGGRSNVQGMHTLAPSQWGSYIFSDAAQIRTRLRQRGHGDSSGVPGAAWMRGADDRSESAED